MNKIKIILIFSTLFIQLSLPSFSMDYDESSRQKIQKNKLTNEKSKLLEESDKISEVDKSDPQIEVNRLLGEVDNILNDPELKKIEKEMEQRSKDRLLDPEEIMELGKHTARFREKSKRFKQEKVWDKFFCCFGRCCYSCPCTDYF